MCCPLEMFWTFHRRSLKLKVPRIISNGAGNDGLRSIGSVPWIKFLRLNSINWYNSGEIFNTISRQYRILREHRGLCLLPTRSRVVFNMMYAGGNSTDLSFLVSPCSISGSATSTSEIHVRISLYWPSKRFSWNVIFLADYLLQDK